MNVHECTCYPYKNICKQLQTAVHMYLQRICCGIAYDGCYSVVQRMGKVSSTVSWALPGQIQSHAVLVIALYTRGGRDWIGEYGYPKGPVGHPCETDYASLTK